MSHDYAACRRDDLPVLMVLCNQVLSGPGEEETFLRCGARLIMKPVRLCGANVLHGRESLFEEVCDR